MERSVADYDVSHESIMVNEADMDFRIPGLPHSVVKHAQSTSVREIIQKIENHPDYMLFNQIYDKNQSFNFFQSLSMSSRREDLMDIDTVKSLETKKYYTANQLKKICKKRDFQGIP